MRAFIDLVNRLEASGMLLDASGPVDETMIERLSNDSRSVRPGSLFAAISGEQVDGHLFIDKAVENGAVAIVCEAAPGPERPGVALAQVTNSRAAWAEMCCEFRGNPSRELRLVGITGTNGKTTVSYLVRDALLRLGVPTGLLGTICYSDGVRSVAAENTTPDSSLTNEWLSEMITNGLEACCMEVSSHALVQHRTRGLVFDVGVFTNLTRDHLDYHASFASYTQGKKRLFDGLTSSSVAVVNADDASSSALLADCQAAVVSYGVSRDAAVRFEVLEDGPAGFRMDLDGAEMTSRLVGHFNAYNVAAAFATLLALGEHPKRARKVLSEAEPVPGRFESFRRRGGGCVIVDYAHTPDALQNVLSTIGRMRTPGSRIWCVFGCGGDRDVEKRPQMGRIAEVGADEVIVTSDNPRSERPEDIMADIKRGFAKSEAAHWIPDRHEAIKLAADLANPEDIVLLAGRGHEAHQSISGRRIEFDDRVEVCKYFDLLPADRRETTPLS